MIAFEQVDKVFRVPHVHLETLKERFTALVRRPSYELLYALHGVSLEVPSGEFLGIIGRNGSGKSTLLKLVAGVLRPTRGVVSAEGPVSPFLELGVGFQNDLTIRDNIYLYGAMLNCLKKEIRDRFDSIVAYAELERFLDMKYKNLSSGMKARLGFATTVYADAPILLVDEVLAVGDQQFQEKCFDTFRSFKRQGKTVMFVTHDLRVAEEYCDRILALDSGRVIVEGEPGLVVQEYTQVALPNRPRK